MLNSTRNGLTHYIVDYKVNEWTTPTRGVNQKWEAELNRMYKSYSSFNKTPTEG